MPAKSVLMFSIDDLRAVDRWAHFAPLVSTPNLDELAERGTSFDRTIAQIPQCNPSRASVLTGRLPSQTGVLDNDVLWEERVDPADTLPAVLRTAGAYVAAFGKIFHNDHVIPPAAQALMFDEFLHPATDAEPGRVIRDDLRHTGPFQSGRYGGPESDLRDAQTTEAAIDFLHDRAPDLDEPFFLGVGISKPHLEWWVPPEFFALYDRNEIRSALERSLEDGTILPGQGEYFDVPPMTRPTGEHAPMAADMDLWVDYIHAYLAAVSYADAKVGAVLDALEEDPALAADTAIVLWSDHGYHLGDKDAWGKFTLWRESTEAPLIVVDPDAPGGQTAQAIVSLVDIFPTVLDLMGLDAPARLALGGNSLLPIVEDVDIDWYDPAAGKGVALSMLYGTVSLQAHVPGEGDLRYTLYPDGNEELYRLTQDPGEHVNRIDYRTGSALTPADDELRDLMRGLMDDRLADAGILLSDGSGRVVGTGAREVLVSTNGPGTNHLSGGGGNDTYVLYRAATVSEAARGGFDSIVLRDADLEPTFALPAGVEMIQVRRYATGNDAANWLFAASGNGGALHGNGGADTVRAGYGSFTLGGGPGADRLIGRFGGDTMVGGVGQDTMEGDQGRDSLLGGLGNDILRGGSESDSLAGQGGSDLLEGGSEKDVFDFDTPADSGPAAPDTLSGFSGAGGASGDRIDLTGIDANAAKPGNQAFAFKGTGPGTIHLVDEAGVSIVLGNTDADGKMELRIEIEDGATAARLYTADDFLL